jgi:hypothetical protein
MSTADGISKALNAAFETHRTDLFDGLVAKLDRVNSTLAEKIQENTRAASQVIAKTAKMDDALCLNCGPNRVKLRQRRFRQPSARAGHEPVSVAH